MPASFSFASSFPSVSLMDWDLVQAPLIEGEIKKTHFFYWGLKAFGLDGLHAHFFFFPDQVGYCG